MKCYVQGLMKFAEFNGRATRTEFWAFSFVNLAVIFAFGAIDNIFSVVNGSNGEVLAGIYALFAFCPALAVTSRRLHDTGRSGWWMMTAFVPVAGFFWFAWLTSKGSIPGSQEAPAVDGSYDDDEEETFAKAA